MIDPATGFSLQLYAGVYGLSSFPTSFDHSFIDTTRIFVVGNGEAPVPDNELLAANGAPGPLATNNPNQLISHGGSAAWFIWNDNMTGKTYAAQASAKVTSGGSALTGPSYRVDTGVRMLEQALAVQQAGAAATTASNSACAANANSADCAAKQSTAAAKVQAAAQYHQNIDVMRSLHNAYGYANYKSDAPFYY